MELETNKEMDIKIFDDGIRWGGVSQAGI